MNINKDFIKNENVIGEEYINEGLTSHDPFIKEFILFCKINGLEERAIELLEKKIREKKAQGKSTSN